MSANVRLPGPTANFDRVIRVRVPRAASLRVTLSANGKTVTESVQGSEAFFFLRKGGQGRGTVLVGSSELYEDDLQKAQQVAVPPDKRPRRFIISTLLRGPGGNQRALAAGLQTLGTLGINTAEVANFGPISSQVAGTASRYGVDHFIGAAYKPPAYFSWAPQANNGRNGREWGAVRANELKGNGIPLDRVVYYQIAEEPTWYFPGDLKLMNGAGVLDRFRNYLQQQGLSPSDLGAGSWAQVQPILQSKATDLPSRRLFYWTMRFYSEGAASGIKFWGDAVRRAVNPNLLTVSNMYNRVNRTYFPAPNQKAGTYKVVGPDTAMASMSWMDIGRKGAPTAMWSEDWDYDDSAPLWDLYADGLRSAAREDQRNSVGGFVVGRRLGNLGKRGAKLKAMALIGHGAKYIQWYNYGPEPFFPEFSWSDHQAAYAGIAAANELIGASEDVLYPGQRRQAAIAIMLPTSAWLWDSSPGEPNYDTDLRGLYFGLTHGGYPVDFVDENDIESGDLASKGYKVLYVTAPNVSQRAQRNIAQWIRGGGIGVFSGPSAAGADEYNSPCSILNEVRGVRGLTRAAEANAALGKGAPARVDSLFAPPNGKNPALPPLRGGAPLQVDDARVAGQFNSGGAAVAIKSYGQGKAYSFGFRPGSTYWKSVARDITHVPTNWVPSVRGIITGPARAANIQKPVQTNVPLVEASRLDSNAGVGVVLLNWSNQDQPGLEVRVRNVGTSNISLASGAPFQSRREGGDLIVSLDLKKNDADVLMLRP
jgi:hypothetical protein